MKNKYDVVIKAHPKDYYKLDLVIETFHFLNPLPDKIYILSTDGYYPEGTSFDDKIIYITDDQVEPFIDRTRLLIDLLELDQSSFDLAEVYGE